MCAAKGHCDTNFSLYYMPFCVGVMCAAKGHCDIRAKSAVTVWFL